MVWCIDWTSPLRHSFHWLLLFLNIFLPCSNLVCVLLSNKLLIYLRWLIPLEFTATVLETPSILICFLLFVFEI